MRTEIVDDDRERAETILLLLARAAEVDDAWQYLEIAYGGWIYGGWVRQSDDGIAEGHTLSVKDVRH